MESLEPIPEYLKLKLSWAWCQRPINKVNTWEEEAGGPRVKVILSYLNLEPAWVI